MKHNNEWPVPKLRGREVLNSIKVYLNTIFKDMHFYYFWVDAICLSAVDRQTVAQ